MRATEAIIFRDTHDDVDAGASRLAIALLLLLLPVLVLTILTVLLLSALVSMLPPRRLRATTRDTYTFSRATPSRLDLYDTSEPDVTAITVRR